MVQEIINQVASRLPQIPPRAEILVGTVTDLSGLATIYSWFKDPSASEQLVQSIEALTKPIDKFIETMTNINIQQPILYLYENYNIPPQVAMGALVLLIGTGLIIHGINRERRTARG